MSKRERTAAGAALTAAACVTLSCSVLSPVWGIDIRADRATYVLTAEDWGGHWVDVDVHITNRLPRPIYLHRHCGMAEEVAVTVTRAPGDTVPPSLSPQPVRGVCVSGALRDPVMVLPRDTYVDRIRLGGWVQSHLSTPVTLDRLTGGFRLVYDVQRGPVATGWDPEAPYPREQTTSATFVVRPPPAP